ALNPRKIAVVHGHGAERVREVFRDADLEWVLQAEQLGTGHAVQQAMPHVGADGDVLILYGDVPLVQSGTLARLCEAAAGGLAVLTTELADPTGYGRILRQGADRIARIVEHKDASPQERTVREINAGFMALPARRLAAWLAGLSNSNAQKEYYLTDIVQRAVAEAVAVRPVKVEDAWEVMGVNSKAELAALERELQERQARKLLDDGVSLADPARIDVRGILECGRDVSIDVNCIFEGRVRLANGVRVGPNCVLRDVTIAE